MEQMEGQQYLNELWNLHLSRSDRLTLLQYLTEFTKAYEHLADISGNWPNNIPTQNLLDISINELNQASYSRDSNGFIILQHLPDQLLQVIQRQLMMLLHLPNPMKFGDVKLATFLMQALIIVSRTNSTMLQNLSSSLVGVIVMLASQVLSLMSKNEDTKSLDQSNFENFVHHAFYFIECLYDPSFVWRNKLSGKSVPRIADVVPLLNVEVIPFFYETLQMHSSELNVLLQQSLLHMFGSILDGNQKNALLATSSTTLETLIKYLAQFMQPDRKCSSESESKSRIADEECVKLVLNLIVTMVHSLHNSGRPDQCQMDVRYVIMEYLKLLEHANANPDAQLQMIGFIPQLLDTRDKAALQMMLLQNKCLLQLKEVLVNFKKKYDEPVVCDQFAVHFTNIVNCLVSGSMSAKDLFSKHIGTQFILENFKIMCIPSRDVLLALLSMGVETDDVLHNPESIKNIFIILMLFDWLPDIQQKEEQTWLSTVLTNIFTCCTTNKIIAGHCKLIKRVIGLLIAHPNLHKATVFNLIHLIEILGSYSITFRQTLAFMELLRQDSSSHKHLNDYFNVVMNSLAVMAHKEIDERKPSYFFDLQDETSGITSPAVSKWGGPGFTVHAWVCLEYFPHKKNYRKRRQLYSFLNDNGVGMEGFFTADCHLVLSVSTKKNYFSVKLNEYPLSDNKWHCIQIVHHSERKLFNSNGTIQVYVDNDLKLSTTLRFPSFSSGFSLCHIGSSGHRTTALPSPDASKSFFSENFGKPDRVVVIDNGSQDEVWGQATSLLGQLGPVAILNDSLKDNQLTALYDAGPDMWKSSRLSDNTFEDVPPSKVVFYYEAKACYRHLCKDLSGNEPGRHGRFTGHKIYTWDIKDTINCVGGISVLMPLLEIIHMRHNTTGDTEPPEPLASNSKPPMERTDSIISSTRIGVAKNPVANFICVLTSFVASSSHRAGWHATNAEIMVKCATAATIGALLQKMPVAMLNESLLCAIQYFATAVSAASSEGNTLLMDIYQYLLFDFRIWCLSDAETQCSHVQYISTLIKEKKKFFRSTFGVQYFLDVIHTFYSSSNNELTRDDVRNIRGSLLGLIRFYVTDDITNDELSAMLNFVSAAKSQDIQICEVFELLKSLWVCKCRDELRGLLAENHFATFLYSFLCLADYSDKVKARVTEVAISLVEIISSTKRLDYLYEHSDKTLPPKTVLFTRFVSGISLVDSVNLLDLRKGAMYEVEAVVLLHLFTSHRAMEKHKQYLRNTSIGFAGVLTLMKDLCVSNRLAGLLLDLFKETDMDGPVFITLAHILCDCGVEVRKALCQHFLTLAYSKVAFLQDCAKQKAWQDVVTRLFVVKSSETNSAFEKDATSPSCDVMFDPLFLGSGHSTVAARKGNSVTSAKSTGSEIAEDIKGNHSNGALVIREDFVVLDLPAEMDGRDLVELAVESVFLIMWRGVTGSDATSWKERGQVFTCLNRAASSGEMILDLDEIKAKLLEHCVDAALSDVRECSAHDYVKTTGLSFSMANENCYELVRLIHDFLMTDGMHKKSLWTEKLMENFFALYESLAVWGMNSDVTAFDTEWSELASIGFRLLCGCIDTEKLSLVAMASAKLHNLVHSRNPSSTNEVCFLLESLHTSVCASIKDNSDIKEFVVSLIRDLLDKNFKRLEMGQYLSELPPITGSSSFFDDFLVYCMSNEWAHFINVCVKPNANHYKKSFEDLTAMMTVFWTDTTEQFMLAYHQKERDKGEIKLRFKANFETDFFNERTTEEERQTKSLKSLRNQNVAVLRQWRATKRFLTSERGFWKERETLPMHWKLSNAENFSRMRLKLTQNYNFDLHKDASLLRDNITLEQYHEKPQDTFVPPSAILASSEASKEDDNMGDEDWSMLANHPGASTDEPSVKEKTILSRDCQLITLMDVVEGKLEISTTHVYFYDKSTANEEGTESGMDFKWSLSQLREVHLRRYNLRKSALELFLVDQTNYFINFSQPKFRLAIYRALLNVRPPNLMYYGMKTPQALLKYIETHLSYAGGLARFSSRSNLLLWIPSTCFASNLTQKWVQRDLSNFDYLMQLNTIAGRTYNDLSQYPVFPWVLKDYKSDRLNLEDPESYRNFTKPMGVQNPKNEQEVRERYDQFEDPHGVIAKFHYGSHYSNAATVLFYMLRMEPFTTLHIQLQAGRFDLADRQFHSLAATFQTVMDTTNDVKELIPEFFYMPEFLVNSNGFDLGKLQFTKETVDHVILPKWAKSPADFIFQHRKALESEHVSANLHHWIDLIFGYKQRGDEAVDALNVFYYCTYEGAVDLDAISDPIQRKAVEGMINNFGQTPTQLLTEPHPRRMTKEEATKKVLGSRIMSTLNVGEEKGPNVLEQTDQLKAFFVEVMNKPDPLIFTTVPKNQSHSFIQSGMPDAMVTMSESGVIGLHGWLPYDRTITNFFTFERDPAVGNSKLQKSVKGHFSPGFQLSPHVFLVTHDAKYLFVGGFWDNSIRVMSVRGKPLCSLVRHLDVVTCLAQDSAGTYLMSGSYDTTCIIWKIKNPASTSDVAAQPLHILYGHQEVITSVVINSELDVALSSSKDGSCVVHSVRKGNYVRTILPFSNNPEAYTVPAIAMSDEGKIVLYARTKKDIGEEKHFLHLYSINGTHLALDCLENRLGHMTVCGEHLVTGDVRGLLLVRELFSFNEVSRLQLCRPIACVHVTKSMTHILACLRDGKLIIVGVDRPAKTRSLFKSTS